MRTVFRTVDVNMASGDETCGLRSRKSPSLVERDDQSVQDCHNDDVKKSNVTGLNLQTGTFWLTRILLLRSLAFIFVVAFLVALHQNKALLGKDGLLPADKYLNDIKRRLPDSNWEKFINVPTFLWFFDYNNDIDFLLDGLAYAGLGLSLFVLIQGGANMFIMAAIWLVYHSIVNVGQRWYSFGWESQILETCFLAIFLCPLLSVKPVPKATPTSFIAILGYRWLIVRIMIGAGLIKIRGDQCWRDLTCMNYHYETQPVPNPAAYFMHQSPEIFHKFETLSNHFVELVAPFLLILNRRSRIIGGCIQVLFQVVLIISGNLSFLNWLTIIPSLATFDDRSISWMFSSTRNSVKWQVWTIQGDNTQGTRKWSKYVRRVFNMSFGLLIAYLSIPIVQNLVSHHQIMNTSFEPLRIVNTYGAFGSITKERTEVIFQGTSSVNPNDANWKDYEFKCKPGDVSRRPCIISPYHYRLDWLMWFAAFQNYQHNPWLVHLAAKFLENDELIMSLIAYNPFEGKNPPKFVRAEHYRYVYSQNISKLWENGTWWKRKRIGEYLPPVTLQSLEEYLKRMGWKTT